MLKKSAVLISSLLLSIGVSHAQDDAKKPTDNEKTTVAAPSSGYTLPEKKAEELTRAELFKAGSYIQGNGFAGSLAKNKEVDGKDILIGLEQKVKNPAFVFNQQEWQKLIEEYKVIMSEKKEVSAEIKAKLGKGYGEMIGGQVAEKGFDLPAFVNGFKDKLANQELNLPEAKVNDIMTRVEAILGEELKIPGQKYLEENKKKEGVITLANGLQYKIIKKGEGAIATDAQTVRVHYTGSTIDGKEFDSSVKRGQPFDVGPDRSVIKGWQEIIKIMPKGSIWQVYIPENLAYGAQGAGQAIGPFATLIFDMEMVDIIGEAKVTPPKGE